MWWRTPWLRQRRLLLGLAMFDGLLLLVFYDLLFWWKLGRWVGVSPSVLVLIGLWVGISYLLGRYSRPESSHRDSSRGRIARTGLVALLLLWVIVVVLNWGLKLEDPRTFRSFVLPLLSGVFLISSLAQVWIYRRQIRQLCWVLVGETAELEVLKREFGQEGALNHLRLIFHPVDMQSQAKFLALADEASIDGIAVSETAPLDDGLLEELLERRSRGTVVCSLLGWAEQQLQRVPPELFSSRWLVQAEGFELQPGRWGWRLKRLGDVSLAGILLLLTAPLVCLAALLIHLEDRGPIFYDQWRTGLYGMPIRIWKLRSMRTCAEVDGARWASHCDPRTTRVGRWLRLIRLDELPQLINVLKGDMSLIGPRPERPELEVVLEHIIPHYRVRHWIRPGLSGWAQVCYPYGASVEDSRAKLSYDLYYLRNANLMLDFLILIKTIRLVATARGAQPKALRSVSP
jgi:exopolysaccharide biosynthesis polyprenyl glycosylphosphotransferase